MNDKAIKIWNFNDAPEDMQDFFDWGFDTTPDLVIAIPKGVEEDTIWQIFQKGDYSGLRAFHHSSLFIGIMHFMDLYNYDINRVKRCCIHYLTPEAIIPFCAFNVIPEWYRDKVQNKYAISFKNWEKKTGKKLKADIHKRDSKTLASSDLYRKTYEGFVN